MSMNKLSPENLDFRGFCCLFRDILEVIISIYHRIADESAVL